MKSKTTDYILIAPAIAIYSFLAYHFKFIQDDAYITYRYVANFLNGDGLVYNIGERIEGFTNFGWTVYLILWGALGLDYIGISQITGYLCGAGLVVATFFVARQVFDTDERWPALAATYLVAVNLSLAYWSPAGLETAAFSLLAVLSLHLYLKQSSLLAFAIAAAVWIRPEGALLAGILIVTEILVQRRFPKYTLTAVAIAFVASLPMVIFKIVYYGSIFPNPFFAKTGMSADQLSSGVEYAGRFLSHYGFYGIGLIVPLVFIRKLTRGMQAVLAMMVFYTAYIILVGGDVLKVHRFFVPILAPSAILLILAVRLATGKLKGTIRLSVVSVLSVAALCLTVYLPWSFVEGYNQREIEFTVKKGSMARQMKASDPRNFSVAIPTIGIFGYELLGHEIIDMVGLTDSTIARHSEPPIQGMETTWKETRHNSKYLLEKAPDYIVFSTGVKPSAPAEKALMLYGEFWHSYRDIPWFYGRDTLTGIAQDMVAFKKMRPVRGSLTPYYPVSCVEHYKQGLESYRAGKLREAVGHFRQIATDSPKPSNFSVHRWLGMTLMTMRETEPGMNMLNEAVRRDSLSYSVHQDLYLYESMLGNTEKAEIHKNWMLRLAPWYFPHSDSLVAGIVRQIQSQ